MRRVAATFVLVLVVALPASAEAKLTFSQVDSADPVNPGDLVTYAVTVRNTGPSAHDGRIFLIAQGRNTQHSTMNNYRSASPSRGSCVTDPNEVGFGEADCELGTLPAGASATIKAVVEMNESGDHWVGDSGNSGSTPSIEPTTVIAPPVLEGSRKIRLKGFPTGCVSGDLKLKAKAKGAKKITASLGDEKLKTAKAKKLKFDLPVGSLEQSSFNELTLKATFRGKPAKKLIATFQRC